ncbi:MAG: hypothetical protein JO257_22775 [Deltaproteobacteria bacterium]|nr:hypothetical protein [Deltaproteobacteria bacterium]
MGVIVRSPEGNTQEVPAERLQFFVDNGYTPLSTSDAGAALTAPEKQGTGAAGSVVAGLTSLASGATLGGSDLALSGILPRGEREYVAQSRENHPYISTAGELVGSLSPVGPAGELTGIGERIISAGEDAGALTKAAYTAGGSAVIGAGQAGGDYLSQVALEDKPLSAEAFVGAMGHGALWGSAIGGALSLSSDGLARLKSLFPEAEVTEAAAQRIDQDATREVSQALDDGDAMLDTSARKLRELRVQRSQVALTEKQQLADLRVQRAQAQLEAEQARTAAAQARAERMKAGTPRTRKAFEPQSPVDAPTTLPETAGPTGETQVSQTSSAQPGGSTLLDQLQATKAGLDAGASLGELSNAQRGLGADVDTALAQTSPEVGKVLHTDKQLRMSRDQVKEWLADVRAKTAKNVEERGYRVSYEDSFTGGKSAAGIGRKLDRVTTLVDETEQAAARRGEFIDRYKSEPTIAERILDGAQPPAGATADAILGASRLQAADRGRDLEATIESALRKHMGEHVDIGPQVDRAAKVLGDYEHALAEHVDALKGIGEPVPATAEQRAQAYRQAQQEHADKAAASSAKAAQDIKDKLQPALTGASESRTQQLAKKIGKAATALELLKTLGVHVPAVSAIPVIGPVLGTFLKAKAVMGVLGRKGGSVARTSEAVIASKAAATRNRVTSAVRDALDVGSRGARAAAPKAAGAAAILAHRLFPAPGDTKANPAPERGDVFTLYQRRLDEVARASPQAIRQAVSDRVQTSDPQLLDSIVDVQQRKLSFLASKMPRMVAAPVSGDGLPRTPSKVHIEQWSRYVDAAENPAGVLEAVAAGHAVTPEAAETLRVVYPSLYREAQMTLLTQVHQMKKPLPRVRRASLSILFGVPLDNSMTPAHIQFLAPKTAEEHAAVQSAMAGVSPGHALRAQVNIGKMTMTSLDRRAAR